MHLLQPHPIDGALWITKPILVVCPAITLKSISIALRKLSVLQQYPVIFAFRVRFAFLVPRAEMERFRCRQKQGNDSFEYGSVLRDMGFTQVSRYHQLVGPTENR